MIAVRMTGVTQRFGNVTALEKVDLEVEQGSIHAIVGENGAGKTTLMRILYGALMPTECSFELYGKPVRFANSKEAIASGIGMVSQHYGIIPELTNLQNLILGAEGGLVLDERRAEARATELADRMGYSFRWQEDASNLSPAGAQKLEILKLLWREAKVMILDEPTAMLSPADSDVLFESMRKLADEGATILLVTHRLPEVMQNCRRVTVLRGGRKVAERAVVDTSPTELANLIVGGNLLEREPRAAVPPGAAILKVDALSVASDGGPDKLKAVSLEARAGEIVGIAGVDGSGQRELFHAIVGVAKPSRGEIQLDGKPVTQASPLKRIEAGLRVIPEDRHAEGIVEDWSLEENSALGLQRTSALSSGRTVHLAARRSWAKQVADKFKTRHGGLGQPIASLSGGNQQRFVAARALEMDPKLILAFQPARGLDLGGTADVYRAIREACDAGSAAVVVSFDLDELLEHCDRIVVMNGGNLFEPAKGTEKDREAIGKLMVGAS